MNNTQDMDSGSGFGALLPMGLGLLGLVLGGAGLYFGMSAKGQIKDLAASNTALIQQVSDLESSKIAPLAAEIQSLKANGPEALRAEIDGKINTLMTAVNENRTQLNETNTKLAAVAKNTPAARPVTRPGDVVSGGAAIPVSTSNGSPAAEPAAAGTHKIVQGEYFATVAKKYGVPVSALEKANPGVDSRRLKIGQSIKIPTK